MLFTNNESLRVMGLKCLQKNILFKMTGICSTYVSISRDYFETYPRCSDKISPERKEREIAEVKILTTGDFAGELKRYTRREKSTCSVVYSR